MQRDGSTSTSRMSRLQSKRSKGEGGGIERKGAVTDVGEENKIPTPAFPPKWRHVGHAETLRDRTSVMRTLPS